jgi:hypothetical protein
VHLLDELVVAQSGEIDLLEVRHVGAPEEDGGSTSWNGAV